MRYKVLLTTAFIMLIFGCNKAKDPVSVLPPPDIIPVQEDTTDYLDVPRSSIYEVSIIQGGIKKKLVVFQNTCPEYQPGFMDMTETDQYPLNIFKGRSISWANFSFTEGSVTVEVKVINKSKVPLGGVVKILPSRYGITPVITGDIVRFTIDKPGQCSVEIGKNGYKNGLMLFANPPETDLPDLSQGKFLELENASKANVASVPANYSGLYFKSGVHDIGVLKVPSNIKNIYLAPGAWIYGALIMDGNPNVKIFGRGVLSSGRLKYRESHAIEAINQSNNIHIEGITVADGKYFTVRLIGQNNLVNWVKIIGGWTYNLDGISAFKGSTVSNCFVWANDDNIKAYRDDIVFKDMVVWQLNNGGVIQIGWTAPNSTNVTIQRIDIIRTEWNKDRFNVGVLNYVGNSYHEAGKTGYTKNWLIEDVFAETPVQSVININPDQFSTSTLDGLTLRNWNVEMDTGGGFQNRIIGNDPNNNFKGIVFDNFKFNGIKFTSANWISLGRFQINNIETPVFK